MFSFFCQTSTLKRGVDVFNTPSIVGARQGKPREEKQGDAHRGREEIMRRYAKGT